MKFNFNDAVYKNWKKNEVARPVSVGFYWILITILSLYLLVGFISPVSAQNMSITDLGIIGEQTVQIYAFNGTLVGTYNTTTNGITLPTEDFVLLVKPDTTSIWSDPLGLLTAGFSYIEANVIPIVIILFFIGLVFRR